MLLGNEKNINILPSITNFKCSYTLPTQLFIIKKKVAIYDLFAAVQAIVGQIHPVGNVTGLEVGFT